MCNRKTCIFVSKNTEIKIFSFFDALVAVNRFRQTLSSCTYKKYT